jgi:hypothetical protein
MRAKNKKAVKSGQKYVRRANKRSYNRSLAVAGCTKTGRFLCAAKRARNIADLHKKLKMHRNTLCFWLRRKFHFRALFGIPKNYAFRGFWQARNLRFRHSQSGILTEPAIWQKYGISDREAVPPLEHLYSGVSKFI